MAPIEGSAKLFLMQALKNAGPSAARYAAMFESRGITRLEQLQEIRVQNAWQQYDLPKYVETTLINALSSPVKVVLLINPAQELWKKHHAQKDAVASQTETSRATENLLPAALLVKPPPTSSASIDLLKRPSEEHSSIGLASTTRSSSILERRPSDPPMASRSSSTSLLSKPLPLADDVELDVDVDNFDAFEGLATTSSSNQTEIRQTKITADASAAAVKPADIAWDEFDDFVAAEPAASVSQPAAPVAPPQHEPPSAADDPISWDTAQFTESAPAAGNSKENPLQDPLDWDTGAPLSAERENPLAKTATSAAVPPTVVLEESTSTTGDDTFEFDKWD